MDERCFTLFEVDIIGEDWRVIVDQDGKRARYYEVINNVGIPPGRRLQEVSILESGCELAMSRLIQNVIEMADGGLPLCTGADGISALMIATKLAKG